MIHGCWTNAELNGSHVFVLQDARSARKAPRRFPGTRLERRVRRVLLVPQVLPEQLGRLVPRVRLGLLVPLGRQVPPAPRGLPVRRVQ